MAMATGTGSQHKPPQTAVAFLNDKALAQGTTPELQGTSYSCFWFLYRVRKRDDAAQPLEFDDSHLSMQFLFLAMTLHTVQVTQHRVSNAGVYCKYRSGILRTDALLKSFVCEVMVWYHSWFGTRLGKA